MGDFAVNVAIAHQIGAARGIYSVLSAMDIRDDELFAAFGRSINDLILRHRKDLERNRETSRQLKIDPRWLEAASTATGPKDVGWMERQNTRSTSVASASCFRTLSSSIFSGMSARRALDAQFPSRSRDSVGCQ